MPSLNRESKRKLLPIQITDRDRELFLALMDYRVLTTDQICHLFFPSLHRTRKRLAQLWKHGLLARAARPTRLGEGSSQYLYALSRRGQQILPNVATQQRASPSTLRSFSQHSERINDFRICLLLAVRMANDLNLSSWTQGRKLKMVAAPRYPVITQTTPIIPDAMFTLHHQRRAYTYFLEIDRGTTDLGRIAAKCAGYHWLWQQKAPQRRFGIRSFRVLLVTTTQKRLEHVKHKLQNLRAYSSCPDLIACTDSSAVSFSTPEKLFAANWQTISEQGGPVSSCPLPVPSFYRSRQRQEHHLCADQNPDASSKEPPGPADEGCPRLPGGGSEIVQRY